MENNETHMLGKTADALTEKTVTIQVTLLHPTWWQRWRKQTKKTFHLQPASLGTLVKISKELLAIELNAADRTNWMELSQTLMVGHSATLARVIALAIVNRKEEPGKKLVSFLLNNLTAKEMAGLASLVLQQMDISSFISSIISIKGVNVLEMSPKDQGR